MRDEEELTEYDKMSINELRTLLYDMGVEYPDKTTRDELVELIKKNS